MSPSNVIPFSGLVSYCQDQSVSYLFSKDGSKVVVSVLDPKNLVIQSQFTFQCDMHPYISPITDDSCVYIPTTDGMLVIDKFSGDVILNIDLNMVPVSNIECFDQNIYVICGLPILKSSKQFADDMFSLLILDKNTGEKKYQSAIMKGHNASLSVDKDNAWCSVGKTIYIHNTKTVMSEDLIFSSSYQPIIASDFVCTSSKMGSLEIFNRTSTILHGKIFIRSNKTPPVAIGNTIYWFVNNELYNINIETMTINQSHKFKNEIISSPVVRGNNIYVCDLDGKFFVVSDNGVLEINIEKTKLYKPLIFDKTVIIPSIENIFKLVYE